jgi:RNA polymerase sigma factor (sigma-70 family)
MTTAIQLKANSLNINSEFKNLVSKELKAMRTMALKLTRNEDDSDDLVQETVLKALKYESNFKEGTNLKGWLYTILRNTFINNYRRNAKRNVFLDTTDNLYFLDSTTEKSENLAEIKFIRKDLETAIAKLPHDLLNCFELNIKGFKYHEIAEELNIPIGTVKTRIFVAKRVLRNSLKAYEDFFAYNSNKA